MRSNSSAWADLFGWAYARATTADHRHRRPQPAAPDPRNRSRRRRTEAAWTAFDDLDDSALTPA